MATGVAFGLLSAQQSHGQSDPQSVSFSFASDDHHAGPTFFVREDGVIESRARVDLMVDVNNHTRGGQVTFQATLAFLGKVTRHQRCPYLGKWLHIWTVRTERLRFDHIAPGTGLNPLLLEVRPTNIILTSISTDPNFVGETMTMQVSELVEPNITFAPGPRMQGIGVFPGDLVRSEDLSFTLTNLRSKSGIPLVRINAAGEFLESFSTEGSFSASADKG